MISVAGLAMVPSLSISHPAVGASRQALVAVVSPVEGEVVLEEEGLAVVVSVVATAGEAPYQRPVSAE